MHPAPPEATLGDHRYARQATSVPVNGTHGAQPDYDGADGVIDRFSAQLHHAWIAKETVMSTVSAASFSHRRTQRTMLVVQSLQGTSLAYVVSLIA
jgi:hypothetical protein